MTLTPENLKRLKSKIWRVNHLYSIKDKDGNIVKFKLNRAQRKYLLWRGTHRYNKIIKPRQKGFTTLHCIDMLDDALFVPGSSCAILAHERQAVIGIFEIVKLAFDRLDDALKPETKYDNKNELQFIRSFTGESLNSKIYVALKLRSGTVTVLHISERAYIKNTGELNAGSKQAVGKSGRITEETTGNGFNEFYDEVIASVDMWDRDNGVPQEMKSHVFFYSWFDDNEYELDTTGISEYSPDEIKLKERFGISDRKIAWRRWKLAELGDSEKTKTGLTAIQLFKQEYPSTLMEAFQASGASFFDQEKVEEIVDTREIRITDYGLGIWHEPIPGHTYVVGVDPSTGKGVDSASISAWDVTPNESEYRQVAQWHGYEDPFQLAAIAVATAELYNRALLSIENNQLTTVIEANRLYDRLYFTIRKDKRTEQRTRILGFSTNLKTRPPMIDNFNKLFDRGLLEINSLITKSEMRTFIIKDNGKKEHADGKHDDALFGDFIALETRDSVPKDVSFIDPNEIGL